MLYSVLIGSEKKTDHRIIVLNTVPSTCSVSVSRAFASQTSQPRKGISTLTLAGIDIADAGGWSLSRRLDSICHILTYFLIID